ncbi:MAG: hypothetical protein WC608_04675 [Parcubacteria group bacterium]
MEKNKKLIIVLAVVLAAVFLAVFFVLKTVKNYRQSSISSNSRPAIDLQDSVSGILIKMDKDKKCLSIEANALKEERKLDICAESGTAYETMSYISPSEAGKETMPSIEYAQASFDDLEIGDRLIIEFDEMTDVAKNKTLNANKIQIVHEIHPSEAEPPLIK